MNIMKAYANKTVCPAILVIALLFFAPTPGKSNETFIDFEDRTSGDILTNEYQSQGVLFSREDPAHQFSGRIITIPEYGCFPFGNTVPNIMHIGERGEPTTAYFVEPGTTTPTVATDVSFLMGDGNIDTETFIVTFFDIDGNILQSNEFTTYESGLLVEFAGPVASITFLLPSYSPSGAALDDFSFTIASTSEPDISIVPLAYDFGEVELGSSSTVFVSISNEGDANLTVNDISLQSGLCEDFSVALVSLPLVIPHEGPEDVEITYTPSAVGSCSGVLEITSDDPDEPVVEIELSGIGIEPAPPTIDDILEFFDTSVENETLKGRGTGWFAELRLRLMRQLLVFAGESIERDRIKIAYFLLKRAHKRCDGEPWPPDFVEGEATEELAEMIVDLMERIAVTQITTDPANDGAPAWAPDGSKIVFDSIRSDSRSIWVMNVDGTNKIRLTDDVGDEYQPHWSSDCSEIVFYSNRSGNNDIWKMSSDGSNLIQLSFDLASDKHPDFSPDGSKILFQSNRRDNNDIWIMDSDGSNPAPITTALENENHPHFSPDGTKIVYSSDKYDNEDILVMDSDGSNSTRLTYTPEDEGHPHFSTDGSKIVFWSERTGNREIWIMNADGSDETQVTNNPADDGGAYWSPDGKKIVFRSDRAGNNDIWICNLW